MKKIVVIGNAGGGKSTLALQLSGRLRLPYHSVDKALWLPGWRPVAGQDFARLHAEWISEPGCAQRSDLLRSWPPGCRAYRGLCAAPGTSVPVLAITQKSLSA